MKWNFNDPTAEKDDMTPLTPAECKAIYMACGVMVVIFAVASLVIYLMTCK